MNLHPLYPAITPQAVLAECARELAQRRNFYPGRVAEGRMSQNEADHQLACAAAWHQDVQRIIAFEEASAAAWAKYSRQGGLVQIIDMPPATHGLSWATRREALRRELALRARVYPVRVAEMRMTQAEADQRRACLDALAARMDDGFDWLASNGHRPRWALIETTPEILAARREWQDHCEAVDTARNPLKQKELI